MPITDITSGLFATISILAALNYRNITGRGQYIDISMLDVNSYLLVNQFMNYIATGINPERLGSAHPSIVPYQVFKAGDDYIAVTVGTEKLWGLFCSALNIENLKNNDRFSTNEKRLENRDELINIINNEFKKYTVDELIKKFNEYGIPCSRVNKISDVIMDKQLNYREMIKDVHFGNKNIKMLNSPV
ncbi:CaiB/BaiF CoA-transferase family protein [Acidiplasma cupricumulans]|uniref:CoA transferase n=1 Tax=Acidiplasma cupricumulans TaxID=312540 RepID=UPI000781D146|nr:CaiB/BaiF CoA-transferase family protein [Acidiplasma cupricumulans]